MANCTDNNCNGFYDPKQSKNGTSNDSTNDACSVHPSGNYSCPTGDADKTGGAFQLTKSADNCFIDNMVNESLTIGGADVNIYKLLGVHEQCKLVDATGNGTAISNGDAPGYTKDKAFDIHISEWHSVQRGTAVTASAFLGYDFGTIKTNDNSQDMYSVNASVRKHITAISIKQSPHSKNRATKVRIERSEDGVKWYGSATVYLPDDDCLNTITFKQSNTMRYWRLRPVEFNGGTSDYWGVQALQLHHNYLATNDDNIQDMVLLENRDRDYDTDALTLKGSYDLTDVIMDLSKFGIEIPLSIYMTVSFSACVAILGRPVVIGDIIELPSEAQYSTEMKKILKWLEVTDVAWSTEGYTPGWTPTLLRIILQPAYASQETQDIFGDLSEVALPDELGLMSSGDGNDPQYQDYTDVSKEIESQSNDIVPEDGREGSSHIREFTEEEISNAEQHGLNNLTKIGLNSTGLYVEDAMPPNNAPFTEGQTYPDNPTHGDYHRITYEQYSDQIPARLYRWSESKSRWVFLESDKREKYNGDRPILDEYLTSPTKKPHTEITKDEPNQCDEE